MNTKTNSPTRRAAKIHSLARWYDDDNNALDLCDDCALNAAFGPRFTTLDRVESEDCAIESTACDWCARALLGGGK